MKFKKKLFEKGDNIILAKDVQDGMIISLSNFKLFYVDAIDEVAELYSGEHADEETLTLTFYNEKHMFKPSKKTFIHSIPYDAYVIAYKQVDGISNPDLDPLH